jgi:hypothetical protein
LKEARPVSYADFLNHVTTNRLGDAFSKPLPYIYDNVYAVNKELRPNPDGYLTNEFRSSLSSEFADGAARVDETSSFNQRYLRDIQSGLPFGRDDAVFVSPLKLIDRVYGYGDSAMMERTLGFPDGTFNASGMTRTYLTDPVSFGLRFANGRESGANPYWLPGGYTYNRDGYFGVPEMVTDKLPSPLVNQNIRVHQ